MSNVGFRVFKKVHRPDRALIEEFRDIPVAAIGDVMNRISCVDARIKPLNKAPLLGPAFTVRARAGDNLMFHHAMDIAEPGDVIIVEGQGDLVNALSGENMMMWSERRGLAGVVVDGAMRDVDSISQMTFPVFCSGIQPNGPYKEGPGEINVPITCGGISVSPGDIIVGDADGIVVIPRRDAAAISVKARDKLRREFETRDAIMNGTWDRSSYTEEALRNRGCEFINDYYS